MCALRGRQPGGRLKSRLFCVTSFRTRVSTPCAVMRLSTVYLLLTDGFANAGVIYGQTPEKPVESRNLRLERLHLTLPKIEYPMLCWSIKMLEISLSNITTQHRIVEVLSSYGRRSQKRNMSLTKAARKSGFQAADIRHEKLTLWTGTGRKTPTYGVRHGLIWQMTF